MGFSNSVPGQHGDGERDGQSDRGVGQVVGAVVVAGPAQAIGMEKVQAVADLAEVREGTEAQDAREDPGRPLPQGQNQRGRGQAQRDGAEGGEEAAGAVHGPVEVRDEATKKRRHRCR
jgi:hypothetical protein